MKFWIKKKKLPEEVKKINPRCVELSDTDVNLIVGILHSYFSQISNYHTPDMEILRHRIRNISNQLQGITNKAQEEIKA